MNNINKECQYLKKTVTDILWVDMKKKIQIMMSKPYSWMERFSNMKKSIIPKLAYDLLFSTWQHTSQVHLKKINDTNTQKRLLKKNKEDLP